MNVEDLLWLIGLILAVLGSLYEMWGVYAVGALSLGIWIGIKFEKNKEHFGFKK